MSYWLSLSSVLVSSAGTTPGSLDEGLWGLLDCEDHRQTDNKRSIITKEKLSSP